MFIHSPCLTARRSEYLTMFLQLRSPLVSTLPLVEQWRDLVCRLFGNVEVFGEEAADGKSRDYPRTLLGSLDMTGCGDLVITSVDAVPAPKRVEFLVQLNYAADTICCGSSAGPSVLLVFGLSYMSEDAVGRLSALIVDQFTECARLVNAKYGIIDVADSMETGIGRWLGASDQLYASFHRRLLRRLWAEEVGRKPKVLGVFWGNLFGPEMIERLGGLAQLRAALHESSGSSYPIRECPNGGAIVLLSERVTDFMYPRLGITWREFDRAAWLHRRLAMAGLLAGTP